MSALCFILAENKEVVEVSASCLLHGVGTGLGRRASLVAACL